MMLISSPPRGPARFPRSSPVADRLPTLPGCACHRPRSPAAHPAWPINGLSGAGAPSGVMWITLPRWLSSFCAATSPWSAPASCRGRRSSRTDSRRVAIAMRPPVLPPSPFAGHCGVRTEDDVHVAELVAVQTRAGDIRVGVVLVGSRTKSQKVKKMRWLRRNWGSTAISSSTISLPAATPVISCSGGDRTLFLSRMCRRRAISPSAASGRPAGNPCPRCTCRLSTRVVILNGRRRDRARASVRGTAACRRPFRAGAFRSAFPQPSRAAGAAEPAILSVRPPVHAAGAKHKKPRIAVTGMAAIRVNTTVPPTGPRPQPPCRSWVDRESERTGVRPNPIVETQHRQV